MARTSPLLPCVRRTAILFAMLLIPVVARCEGVRFTVAIGGIVPRHYAPIDKGYLFGAGFEAQQSPLWSVVGDAEYSYLTTGPDGSSIGATSILLGLRAHAFPAARVRPYAQVAVGMRIGGKPNDSFAIPQEDADAAKPGAVHDGGAASLRVGVTTAAFHGAGVFFDGGLNVLLKNAGDYALAPIRAGLAFH